ncbi:hypothetical protein M378DRAFT_26641 [Amanita muscaria Koide BX008]|uniref:Uncharacterized protein n=1 Tax=Amanita muscaria (strain Koide BX008) TaxID=946122 RepID=A0A0C2WUZ0_AMAMK|nr:hypothetical protein M378DRAFT_26641 [Amanita muscaria Koide BX008]
MPHFPPGFVPSLQLLTLECNNTSIGFDESEYVLAPPETSQINKYPVKFYGLLKIESLDWLSDEGKQLLEADYRKRDERLHAVRKSELTLETLYGDAKGRGSQISVFISAEKTLAAEYMTSERHRNSFLIHSHTCDARGHNRLYKVLTLEDETAIKSRNFIARFSQWACINKLIELDGGATPIQDRTIDWIITRYIDGCQNSDDPAFRSVVDWTRDVSSDEEDVNMDGENTINVSYRRHERHIPRSEVESSFASQCEWLLAHQLAPQSRSLWKLNMRKWVKFCRRSQIKRTRAVQNGYRAVLPHGTHEVDQSPLPVQLAKFSGTAEIWENKLKNLEINWLTFVDKQVIAAVLYPFSLRVLIYYCTYARMLGMKLTTLTARTNSTSLQGLLNNRSKNPSKFHYDKDFSEHSTPGDINSDDEILRAPPEVVSASHTSSGVLHESSLDPGWFKWDCAGCNHTIDLFNLEQEQLELLPRKLAEYIKSLK